MTRYALRQIDLISNSLSALVRLRLVRAAFFLASLAASGYAFAFGFEGHEVVALVADSNLTPKARAGVQALLSLEPGATLASISTWADEHKNPTTAAWHYVNLPRWDCAYDAKRDCPGGKCVVSAIQRQTSILKSDAEPAERLVALKYLVHLVGDVHQPLHAGFADDKGGNKYQVHFAKRGTNLHALWDTGLVKSLNETPEALAARLQLSNLGAQSKDFNPALAAEESCQIVNLPGFYPQRRVGQDYANRFTPVAEQRLALAGIRLAELLNRVFR